MKLSEFNYKLPKELVAQIPASEREKCRLMVLDRASKNIYDRTFNGIVEYFNKGDCLVLNDTKVIPARLFGKRKTGGKVELFLLDYHFQSGFGNGTNPDWKYRCEALVKPSGRLKEGEKIVLESGDEVEILNRGDVGRFVKFTRPINDIIGEVGHIPLPPYIGRDDTESDKSDYQTVYANREGATASPTAGLHFTEELLSRIASRGVRIAYVTLHTNYGTFAPIKTDNVESHKMHKEYFELSVETIKALNETKRKGGEVFAVGTTTTRVLEFCADKITQYAIHNTHDEKGYTDMYVYPGYEFKIVDHLITNFHLPKSTLMLLVSAFAGKEFILGAYRHAIEEKYRFFSYGDAMLIL